MAVESSDSQVSYDCDGSTTVFPVPFYFQLATDLTIELLASDGTITPVTSGYEVAGAGSESGGSVTTDTAYASGRKIVISRIAPLTQEVRYQSNNAFPAKTQEKAYDKLTMIAQQHQRSIGRSIQFPDADVSGASSVLPASADRANRIPAFDESGNVTTVIPSDQSASALAIQLNNSGGAAQIGFLQGGPGAILQTLLKKLMSLSNHPGEFGGVPGVGIDNTQAVIRAFAAGKINGQQCFLPPGRWEVSSQIIHPQSALIGIPGLSELHFTSSFSFPGTGVRSQAAFTNPNLSTTFNLATADILNIDGIDFYNHMHASSGVSMLLFANVKGGRISNFNMYDAAETYGQHVDVLLDFYACCKYVHVSNFNIVRSSASPTGSAAYVRNITSTPNDNLSYSEGITFANGYMETNCGDEAFAVYGVFGISRNVKVDKSVTIRGVKGGVQHGTLVSVFPLSNGGANTYAQVSDIVIEATIIDESGINEAYRVGASDDINNICSNVHFRGSIKVLAAAASDTSSIARNIPCLGRNCTIEGDFDATASLFNLGYGINGFDQVTRSTVRGAFSQATAYACKQVFGNFELTNSLGDGTLNCNEVHGNFAITAAKNGVQIQQSQTYSIYKNNIRLTASSGLYAGVLINGIASQVPAADIDQNQININNASAFGVLAASTTFGDLKVRGNTVTGSAGKSISGFQRFTVVEGNSWYGSLDRRRSAGFLDSDHNTATPIGTICEVSSPTVGTNTVRTLFQKVANAGVATDWKPLYTNQNAS